MCIMVLNCRSKLFMCRFSEAFEQGHMTSNLAGVSNGHVWGLGVMRLLLVSMSTMFI